MYNQFDLCKQCDDEPAIYSGLCHTCLDTSDGPDDLLIGGTHVEKFSNRKVKNRKKTNRYYSEEGETD